jgi:hypothetical protein
MTGTVIQMNGIGMMMRNLGYICEPGMVGCLPNGQIDGIDLQWRANHVALKLPAGVGSMGQWHFLLCFQELWQPGS